MVAAVVASFLGHFIALITNAAFYGRFSTEWVEASGNHLGVAVIAVPVIGSLLVGLLVRYGSPAIRGHGIPEAMEKVLFEESRIPPSMIILKPLSAAIAIGTGGPFGAEGPIIATGGALGSLLGQVTSVTADERKTLLAAGAAAGMTATFGTPVSAVLLAIELLLFEYRARSLVPVALATVAAASVRLMLHGSAPVFPMTDVVHPEGRAMVFYGFVGLVAGVAAIICTKLVYAVEDAFERLPFDMAWWPAIGGLFVGVVGYFVPQTLGVGYTNIIDLLNARLELGFIAVLVVAKLASWSVALGSGTSGGTLAPLFTIGSCIGCALGIFATRTMPWLDIDPRIAALVAMAAIFAGASRALLASVIFAFETTRQPLGLLPLLAGCSSAYLVVGLTMKNSIMTEKIARRGLQVPSDYEVDVLTRVTVSAWASREVLTILLDETLGELRARLNLPDAPHHHGFPVVDAEGELVGVITRSDLREGSDTTTVREIVGDTLVVVEADDSLREAADRMLRHGIGRLPVVHGKGSRKLVGILTRSDLLAAHASRLDASHRVDPGYVRRVRASRGRPR